MNKSENFDLIYGIMLGDGCLSKIGRAHFISISSDLHTDLPFVEKYVPILEGLRGKKVPFYLRKKCGKIEVIFSDKKLFGAFEKAGFPIGKKGKELLIPNNVTSLRNIVRGYFATDGCLVLTNNNNTLYPRLEFSSISHGLLLQVKDYLDSIGIVGKIYVSKRYTNGWKTLYRLQINGKKKMFLFDQKIGFINPKHKKRHDVFK